MKCKICANESTFLFSSLVLNKYEVDYFKCPNCDFIQTEKPFWIKEAYNNAIADLDVGLVTRNLFYSEVIERILKDSFKCSGKFLDYAGGYGLFVRLMRDKGFDFYREDKYCENIFSQNFDLEDEGYKNKFEAVTAFEVFEHLENPLEEIEKMFKYSDTLIFSTELQSDGKFENSNDWWYFVPETGQHIAFYSEKTLLYISDKLNCSLFTSGNLHLLSIREFKFNPLWVKEIKDKSNAKEMNSLMPADFEFAKKIVANASDIRKNIHVQNDNIENNNEKLIHSLSLVKTQLDATNVELDSTKTQLDATNVELDSTKTQLDTTNVELDSTKTQLDATNVELDSTKTQLDLIKAELDVVRTSREFKVGLILQKIVKILIPNGSKRRKLAVEFFGIIKVLEGSLTSISVRFKNLAYQTAHFFIQRKINSYSDGQKKKLLIDCSYVYNHPELNTGIQRVVKNVLKNIDDNSGKYGVQIVPVIMYDKYLIAVDLQNRKNLFTKKNETGFFAWRILKKLLKMLESYFFVYNNVITINKGDIYLILDSLWLYDTSSIVRYVREKEGIIVNVIYDLIPIRYPQFSSSYTTDVFSKFYSEALKYSDGFIAISKTVMYDLMEYADSIGLDRYALCFDYFVLGSDFKKQEYILDNIRRDIVDLFNNKSVFLTVSTIEPRKNHAYLVDSFEKLWEKGIDAKLCIVGKVGWNVDELVERIKNHKEYNKKLFMFNNVSDEELSYCYKYSKMLVFASFVEGFGLPIVESLNNGLPVLASDTPIHHEVGKDMIEYFDLGDVNDLASKVEIIEKEGLSEKKVFKGIKTNTWQESSTELLGKIMKISDEIEKKNKK